MQPPKTDLLTTNMDRRIFCLESTEEGVSSFMPADRFDVLHGSLALMVLRTLDALGPLHGYGIARGSSRLASTSSR